MRRTAFTLVELLVVIAIIIALLAILMPSMSRAIEITNRAVCASNLHQTHVAHLAWASDHFGSFVVGQPIIPSSGVGHYAVWYRGYTAPAQYEGYGSYLKHGVLVRQGYLPDAKTFYCPSWTGVANWEKTGSVVPGFNGGGWFEDEADIPTTQGSIQTTYHYNSSFGSPWRSARLAIDKPTDVLMADAFSDYRRSSDLHHIEGYSVLRLGGSVTFFNDPQQYIRDAAGVGVWYHAGTAGYQKQAEVWRVFADIENAADL